ncbi:hypothetical protein K456DRAFT_1840738 [Colletotrichum gloeosporioides 23]|nr:hypothetical protein K456DRAFT_1840738 [Colletotrichum gloeosporioides 23]
MSSAIPLSPNPNAEIGPPATPPDASAGVKRSRRESRQHRCAYCPKVFKRSEHCIRHERSHTNEKPYSCQYCHKCYARKYAHLRCYSMVSFD